MRLLLCLLAATGAAVVVAVPVVNTPRHRSLATAGRQSRSHASIIKGKYGKSKSFPYQVYLRVFLSDGTVDYCGGAIISQRHVLSAAHCVNKKVNVTKTLAVVGSENRFSNKALVFKVVRKTLYPKTKDEKVDADIVLLTVDRSIPLGRNNVKMIRLKTDRYLDPMTKCSVAGWGTSRDDTDPNILKYINVPPVKRQRCLKAYPDDMPDDLLCAGYYEAGGKDTCQGDSGSPLVCASRLTGLVKGGVGCGLPHYPGTYTDVSYYWRWVKKAMIDDLRTENLRNARTRYLDKF